MSEKQAIHASQIAMAVRCGMQFQYRYIEGKVRPPGIALVAGSTLHKVREVDLLRKAAAVSTLTPDEAAQMAAIEFDRRVDTEGLEPDEDERHMSQEALRGSGVDLAVSLAVAHNRDIVPLVTPTTMPNARGEAVAAVELALRVEIPGVAYPLEGTIDTIDVDGVLRDCKSSGKKLGRDTLATSIQLPFYALLMDAAMRVEPTGFALDVVQKLKRPAGYVVSGPATTGHQRVLSHVMSHVQMLEGGNFRPADPDHWVCSKKFCGYFDICPFGARGRIQIQIDGGKEA